MKCPRPVELGTGTVTCGQCMPCRINRQRMWAGRVLLESFGHPGSTFLTLTYKDAPRSLQPRDLANFWKRLRHRLSFRYFGVGEYGDEKGRPHYHAVLFGHPASLVLEEIVKQTWNQGFIQLDELTPGRAMYVAHYATKKWTRVTDHNAGVLDGRHPEFAHPSRRPGIGKLGIPELAAAHQTAEGSKAVTLLGDVIPEFRYLGKRYPLGETMTKWLRQEVGIPTEGRRRAELAQALGVVPRNRDMAVEEILEAQKAEIRLYLKRNSHGPTIRRQFNAQGLVGH